MSIDYLIALTSFTFVSSITPGPNNIMLMTSGANFGLKRTLPHLSGVTIGFVVMVILVGLGIMQLFELWPITHQILRVVSFIYLLYLAYRIATSNISNANLEKAPKPLTFLQAALFQWVNPKAWTMAVMAISLYAPSQEMRVVLVVAAVFGLVNIPCILSWAALGKSMNSTFKDPKHFRLFNISMAILLVLSVILVM